jgi:hypothetical protein
MPRISTLLQQVQIGSYMGVHTFPRCEVPSCISPDALEISIESNIPGQRGSNRAWRLHYHDG